MQIELKLYYINQIPEDATLPLLPHPYYDTQMLSQRHKPRHSAIRYEDIYETDSQKHAILRFGLQQNFERHM